MYYIEDIMLSEQNHALKTGLKVQLIQMVGGGVGAVL